MLTYYKEYALFVGASELSLRFISCAGRRACFTSRMLRYRVSAFASEPPHPSLRSDLRGLLRGRGSLHFVCLPRLSASLLAPLRGLASELGASSSLLRFGLAGSPRLSTQSTPQSRKKQRFYYNVPTFSGGEVGGERSDLRSLRSPKTFPCSYYEAPTFLWRRRQLSLFLLHSYYVFRQEPMRGNAWWGGGGGWGGEKREVLGGRGEPGSPPPPRLLLPRKT